MLDRASRLAFRYLHGVVKIIRDFAFARSAAGRAGAAGTRIGFAVRRPWSRVHIPKASLLRIRFWLY